jgi:hypothetical protein
MKNSQFEDIRESLGLPAAKPGITTCLMCGNEFYSQDKKKYRRCDSCTLKLKQYDDDSSNESYWDELDDVEVSDEFLDFMLELNTELQPDIKSYK